MRGRNLIRRSRFKSKYRRRPSLWKGAVAGLVGGLAASWVMNEYQKIWMRIGEQVQKKQNDDEPKTQQAENEDVTIETASIISENVFDHELSDEEKKTGGPAVHYAFGAAMGGLFGAAAEVFPRLLRGTGIPFGTSVWLGVDEIALPVLGLSKKPNAYRFSTHVYALTSHFVYGFVTDVVRRFVRKLL